MSEYMLCLVPRETVSFVPVSLDVSRDEVEGDIESEGKTKLTIFRGNRYWLRCTWRVINYMYYWVRFFLIFRIIKGEVILISLIHNKSGKQEKNRAKNEIITKVSHFACLQIANHNATSV